jgi:Tfp pilus assembly protein FimV
MRKDVRFGLTIGGSILAVLVIWVALADRGGRKSPDIAVVPATQPSDSTSAPLSTITSPQSGDAMSVAPLISTTQPSVADNSHDWTHLLDSGAAPAMAAVDNAPATQPSHAVAVANDVPATQPAVASTARTHKVAPGETFYTIAASVYGDGKYFGRIEDANPTINPNRLRVGTVINIPDAGAASAAVTASDQTPAPDTLDASKSYRIQPSDTLMSIARKLYGNGQAWQKIYDANKDAIGPNPARLKVGTVLRLPSQPLASAN